MRAKLILISAIIVVLTAYISLKPSFRQESQAEQPNKGEKTMVKKIKKSDKEWKNILTPEQYRVMRKRGTERAFSGIYNAHYEKGIYVCAGCCTLLFSSDEKYDHGTGWPSFAAPVDENHVEYFDDYSHFMHRIEVRCAVCGAHLGHVFDDGPPPTRKHYCINSLSLDFKPADNKDESRSEFSNSENPDKEAEGTEKTENAIFAAGCFWGVEHKFRQIPGVLVTEVGYTGGHVKNPTYKQVCTDKTGHAEAVKITYDPSQINYEKLLEIFFSIHDPTQMDRQGLDIGTQYRSVVFYFSKEQKEAAEKMLEMLQSSGRYRRNIVTEIVPASEFYRAEEYHHQYYEKRGISKKGGCGTGSCEIK